jgi:hypothetical protein
MPDFIRIVERFPTTDTNKIVVRPYKSEHYNIEKNPCLEVFYRTKGDTTFSLLTPEKYISMKEYFIKNGRESVLE